MKTVTILSKVITAFLLTLFFLPVYTVAQENKDKEVRVRMTLESVPPGARVIRDGVVLGKTPLMFEVKKSAIPVECCLQLKGYLKNCFIVVPDQDRKININMMEGMEISENINAFFVPMDPFVVNLNEEGLNRYLKLSFSVEVEKSKDSEKINHMLPAVRDGVILYLSGLKLVDVQGSESKLQIKEYLLKIVQDLSGARANKIWFTEFVVQ